MTDSETFVPAQSLLPAEAVAAGLLIVHPTARVYAGVRLVPTEDNGQN